MSSNTQIQSEEHKQFLKDEKKKDKEAKKLRRKQKVKSPVIG